MINIKTSNVTYAIALALVVALAIPSQLFAADPLAKPTGKIILSISGNLTHTNTPGAANFDRAMLEALGMETLVTTTSWNKGKQTFDGVPLKTLMEKLNARGETITGFALNDYSSKFPFADIVKYNPLLALKRNGEYMPVRDKGPVWIVFPRDDFKELLKVQYDHSWIWQLRRLHVQ
ncbi:MAG: molybdopterin-dependent oxidoreductase [Alphaproteobacteria bacterium]